MAKIYRNKKTKGLYKIVSKNVINSTNDADGQMMILYTDREETLFVRESQEFKLKFYLTELTIL
jgi:hypothetical protein